VSSFDEQDLGQRIDGALATITSGPAPVAAIVARGRRVRRRRNARAGALALAAALAVAIPGLVVHGGPSGPPRSLPTTMSGLPLPAAFDLKLLITTPNGAAWYSTATRRAEPIAGLPAVEYGYQFGRLNGGWWAKPFRITSTCPYSPTACHVGPPVVFYFIADGSLTATRIGAAFGGDGVVASSRPGAVWLATYPSATTKIITGSSRAQLVSTSGQTLSPRYRLPADYLLGSGVGNYLLLLNNKDNNLTMLWDPRTGRVVRRFDNVIATGPEQIAWSAGCRACRVQVLNVSTGKTVTTGIPGSQPAALNATMSDDGTLLAVQLPSRGLGVLDTGSNVLTVIPGTALSKADWQHFNWLNGGHRLIVTAGPNTQPGPVQVGYWQPGDTGLRIATIRNLDEISTLETGSVG
jgi:hypothetical protein